MANQGGGRPARRRNYGSHGISQGNPQHMEDYTSFFDSHSGYAHLQSDRSPHGGLNIHGHNGVSEEAAGMGAHAGSGSNKFIPSWAVVDSNPTPSGGEYFGSGPLKTSFIVDVVGWMSEKFYKPQINDPRGLIQQADSAQCEYCCKPTILGCKNRASSLSSDMSG